MTSDYPIVSIKLLPEVGGDEYIIVCHFGDRDEFWSYRGGPPRRPRSQEGKKARLNRVNISQRYIGTRGVQANVLIENCWQSINSEKNESTTSNTRLKYHTLHFLITFNTIWPINPTPLYHKIVSEYWVRFLHSIYKKWSHFSYTLLTISLPPDKTIKWDHFEILASGKTDYHCKIKETLFIEDLKPAFNDNISSEMLMLY